MEIPQMRGKKCIPRTCFDIYLEKEFVIRAAALCRHGYPGSIVRGVRPVKENKMGGCPNIGSTMFGVPSTVRVIVLEDYLGFPHL